MQILKTTGSLAIVAFGLATGGTANAALYTYTGAVTLCTGTCDSFAALAVGTELSATFELNLTPSSTFGDADVVAFEGIAMNPALPPSTGGTVTTDNPIAISLSSGVIASNGSFGTTDAANQITSGQLILEFLVPPYSSNGAYMIFDLTTGSGAICLFYATAGCIPGATEAGLFEGTIELQQVPIPAAVWLFGSALAGLGFTRRRK